MCMYGQFLFDDFEIVIFAREGFVHQGLGNSCNDALLVELI
jgi:hypothetical protein